MATALFGPFASRIVYISVFVALAFLYLHFVFLFAYISRQLTNIVHMAAWCKSIWMASEWGCFHFNTMYIFAFDSCFLKLYLLNGAAPSLLFVSVPQCPLPT